MQNLSTRKAKPQFQKPEETLGDLETDVVSGLIAAASDVALVLDSQGVIRDIAFGNDELASQGFDTWRGRHWSDVVTVESKPKLKELMKGAESGSESAMRWRQVNHPSPQGGDIPIKYLTFPIGKNGRILAVGREMQALANLQQRLVEAQVTLEREYARLRSAENRYKLIFQMAKEAMLIVDSATSRVVEANPAAVEVLGQSHKRILGANPSRLFAASGADTLGTFIAKIRETGRAPDISIKIREDDTAVNLSGSIFRQEAQTYLLLRVKPASEGLIAGHGEEDTKALVDILARLPDAFVVTDMSGRILKANTAFLDMTQVSNEDLLRGEPLDRWLGQSGIDLNIILANLKEHGSVRLFSTVMRSEYNTETDVEVSAVSSGDGTNCIGFAIRSTEGRLPVSREVASFAPQSAEQLTNLVGRVPLKNLVQETTDIIEKLCIESALELTGDNRASAAEMLGVSRQSLYVKMRRYGIGHLDQD